MHIPVTNGGFLGFIEGKKYHYVCSRRNIFSLS